MKTKPKQKAFAGGAETTITITLQDVLNAVEGHAVLSATRRRDLRSSIKRVASLLTDDPARIPLDFPTIGAKLATISPVAAGLSSKSLSNIRSDFLAAVQASGLKPVQRLAKTPLSAAWTKLVAEPSQKRARIGLSRLGRHACALGLTPEQINTAVIDNFIAAIRDGSLHRKPNALHRMVSRVWNEVAQKAGHNLQMVIVPSFRPPIKRIDWMLLPNDFRNEVLRYLIWCGGTDAFAANARSRALKPRTLKLRRNQIHAAVTALVGSRVPSSEITSLADLVSPENFTRILRRRNEAIGGRENSFNSDLAKALVAIAREWVKVDAAVLTELKRLTGKVPIPASGLTNKNKCFLRQFDDSEVLRRLHNLPERLWAEVKRDKKQNQQTLARAQVAVAVAILCYMPIRLQNLTSLTFGVHLFLREGARATSTLELSAGEVKNDRDLAFDIPSHVAKMLLDYRNKIAPSIIGHRPERLFVTIHGTPKSHATLACLMRTYLNKRAGIVITAHQFRHVGAKVLLDAEPGSFETVRQLLGHKSLRTTVASYAGIDSRRAGRHHAHLIEEALAAKKPREQRQKRAS
jgi:integrase